MTKMSIAACAAAGALAPACLAQTFVSFELSERHFYAFEAGHPGTERLVAIGEGSSYVRGLEMTDERNGWFIVTQSENDSAFGLFRIQDGSVGHVANLPFQTTAIGGMTFNENADGFYVALNPPSAPTTLYRMTFGGELTPVGPMMVEELGSVSIAGLAVDPRSGLLYGLDTRNDLLLRIDPESGHAETIGFGLGMNAVGAGGLDFAYVDGQWRLFGAVGTSGIREFDIETGLWKFWVADLPFGPSGAFAAVPTPAGVVALLAGGVATAARRRRG